MEHAARSTEYAGYTYSSFATESWDGDSAAVHSVAVVTDVDAHTCFAVGRKSRHMLTACRPAAAASTRGA